MKFLIEHIAPIPGPATDFIFYFYHHSNEHGSVISQIALRIEQMNPIMKQQLERALDLQLLSAPRDDSGNVCFADAPDLRPEFRTTFGPIDLWDYYYALFHNPNWWESYPYPDQELPFPSADQFWSISAQGKKLRRIHSSKILTDKYQFDLHVSGKSPIQAVSTRFQVDPSPSATGRLYLNDQDYIGRVPYRAWNFQLAGQSFLADKLGKWTGQVPDQEAIQSLLEWIVVVDRTSGVSEIVSG